MLISSELSDDQDNIDCNSRHWRRTYIDHIIDVKYDKVEKLQRVNENDILGFSFTRDEYNQDKGHKVFTTFLACHHLKILDDWVNDKFHEFPINTDVNVYVMFVRKTNKKLLPIIETLARQLTYFYTRRQLTYFYPHYPL